MEFKKAESGNIIKLEANQSIEGEFISIEESVKYPDSYLIKIKDKKGVLATFVSGIVKTLIQENNILAGMQVKLTYNGMKETKDGARSYKDYTLFYASI